MSTRAVLRFDAATVQVLITQRDDGQSHGSAVVELAAGSGGMSKPLHAIAPTAKEAWARLALMIGQALAACLVLVISSCAPPPQVACSGPAPITCECVTTCSSDDAGVVTTEPPLLRATLENGCVGRCWDRSKGGTP